MQFRIIFKVQREVMADNIEEVREQFAGLMDEPDEFLYGGAGLAEQVGVAIEFSRDEGKTWEVLEVKAPR